MLHTPLLQVPDVVLQMSATSCIEGETIHMLATADTPVDALDKDGFEYSWSIVNEATEVATAVDDNTSNTLDYKCTVLGKFYVIVTAKGAYTGSGTTTPATAYAVTTSLVPAAFDSIDLVQTAVIGEEVTLTVRISDTHTSDMKTLVVCWIAPGKQPSDSITVNAVQLDAKGRRVETRRFIEKHIYNELGTFSVKITVVDSAGCATVTHRQITIIPAVSNSRSFMSQRCFVAYLHAVRYTNSVRFAVYEVCSPVAFTFVIA
jgi:Tfp pilus assembly protein PilZ